MLDERYPPFGAAPAPSGDCQLDVQNGLIWRAVLSGAA
jgi:hypothetical protein